MKTRAVTLFGVALILAAAAYIFAMVEGGFLPWFVFSFFVTLFVYEIITFLAGFRQTSTTRILSARRLTAGQTLEVEIAVERNGIWPMFWLRVTDELPTRWVLQTEGSDVVTQPLWRHRLHTRYKVVGVQRGIYRIGATRVETGDLLGIVRCQRRDERRDEVLVYPRVVPVRGWASNSPEELGLRQPTRRRTNESTNVIGVRDYVPGDRLSRIHWPASARKGMLQAKEFELHVSSEILFVPDLSASSFKSTVSAAFELEMSIVASLLKQTYEMRRMFAATFHGSRLTQFSAGADEALFLRCMDELAVAVPDGHTEFPKSLVRIAQEASTGTTLVVVSPRLDREAAVAAEMVRRRSPVEWFVPMDHAALTDSERQGLKMLQAARVNVYLIGGIDQLGNLRRGGVQFATGR